MISFCCTFFSNDSPSLRRAHCHGEHRAVCLVGAHRYLAVHEFGEVFDYGKSRSVAAVLTARLVRAVEPLKDVSLCPFGVSLPVCLLFSSGFHICCRVYDSVNNAVFFFKFLYAFTN